MHNNKEFHVLEREEYRQLKGTEVDLMRVTCKLQTFWYSGSSFRPLFRCNRTKTLRQIDSKAIQKKKKAKLSAQGEELHVPEGPWNHTMRASVEKV